MQDNENTDEKLIEAPNSEMFPTPELELPAQTPSSPTNTGIIIIVALLVINLILGVYVYIQYAAK